MLPKNERIFKGRKYYTIIHKDHHAMKEVARNLEYKDRIYGLETFLMKNNQH